MADFLETGILKEVTETEGGSSLAADVTAGALVLPLVNADDFNAPGLVEVNGASYLYVEVTDDEELILDPSTPAAALTADEPVFALSMPGTREIVRKVWLHLDEAGEAVPAVVPSGKRGIFPVGDRDAGSVVEVMTTNKGLQAVSRPVDEDVYTGVTLQTGTTGNRVVVRSTFNIFEADQEWGLIEFFSSDPGVAPGLIWGKYTPGATDEYSLRLSSPYLGTDWGDAAFIDLISDETGASSMAFGADSFYLGSGGSSIDFHAVSTNQFQFFNTGGSHVNMNFTLTENSIGSYSTSAQMRLRLIGSDVQFSFSGENLFMLQATGVARPIIANAALNSALLFGNAGSLRATNFTGTSFIPIEASAFTVSSDGMNKSDEQPLEGALEVVRQWQPKDYQTTQGAPEGETVAGRGFIAQEMVEVTPELVKPDSGDGSGLTVDVMGTVATLAAAVKELDAEVTMLRAEVAALKK